MLTASCALGIALAPSAAAVTDEEFQALQKMVKDLADKVQQMQQVHQQDQQVHQQDQETHQQDQKQLQKLLEQVEATQQVATNAAQKADAASSQVQAVHPIPTGALSATHNASLVGDAEVQFGKMGANHSTFEAFDFAPIFLYRGGDKVLFEAGFDFTLQNGTGTGPITGLPHDAGTSYNFDLSFATLDYMVNDYVTLVAGNMLLPLGTYSERSAGWLNKFPDNPLPRNILPNNGIGAQLRGAVPIGDSGQMVTYSVYGDNGPSSTDFTGAASTLDLAGNVGLRSDAVMANLNSSPSGGGRLGYFIPLKPNYDFEIGISGQTGQWMGGDAFQPPVGSVYNTGNGLRWSAAVLDAALHVSPYVEVKGEYMNTWQETSDLGTIQPNGWWVQAGYKLAGLGLEMPVINDIELVGRYDKLNDGMGSRNDRYSVGYVYYITNTLLFEGDYEFIHGTGPNPALASGNAVLFQLSYGF